MVEALLGILILLSIAILVLHLRSQNASSPTDMKFQTSLDEKIKSIHDEIGRNREESNKTSLENRQELSKTLLFVLLQFF